MVTSDETWIQFFEPENKQQSSVWKHPSSPSPTKALISKSAGKVMAIIFCDIQSLILNHFAPPKTTVTGNYYATVIKSELLPAIKRKRPHLEGSWILLHHAQDTDVASIEPIQSLLSLYIDYYIIYII